MSKLPKNSEIVNNPLKYKLMIYLATGNNRYYIDEQIQEIIVKLKQQSSVKRLILSLVILESYKSNLSNSFFRFN